jgi:cytochrome oxidase assembly protein ShyY1
VVDVLRMLSTGKWIALTILLVVAISAFGALSIWQWQRAQRDRTEPAAVPASDVLRAGTPLAPESYGVPVTAAGSYDAAHQLLVQRGSSWWVVTPLRPVAGPAIPVARAVVSSPTDPAVLDVTAGTVTITGYAQPYDGDPGTPSTLPAGQSDRLTEKALALPYAVTGGWVALSSQQPAPAVQAAPVPPPYGPSTGAPLRLQNLSYALQWLVFAGFAVFVWWRALRDDLADLEEQAPPSPVEPVRDVY